MSEWTGITERLGRQYGLERRPDWPEVLNAAATALATEWGLARDAVPARVLADPALWRAFVAKLTVGESHFFRHPEHLQILRPHVAARLQAGQPVTIWSAGCSRGEEPYSVAMSLIECCGAAALERVTILASDLNPEAIAQARSGRFHSWSSRGLSAARRSRFFRSLEGGEIELAEDVRSRVVFSTLSAQEHARLLPPASLDAVFFRNVAIYMKAEALDALLTQIAWILREDALLFMAPADPRPPSAWFSTALTESTCAFRKRRRDAGAAPQLTVQSVAKTPSPARSPVPAAPPPSVRETGRANEDDAGAAPALGRLVLDEPHDLIGRLRHARALSRRGERRRALFHVNAILAELAGADAGLLLPDGRTTAARLLSATLALKERIA